MTHSTTLLVQHSPYNIAFMTEPLHHGLYNIAKTDRSYPTIARKA